MNMTRVKVAIICIFGVIVAAYIHASYLSERFLSDTSSAEKHIIYNKYCVLPNVVRPTSNEEERISQILHMSSNYLDDRLIEQVNNWNGPVSLSVVLLSKTDYHCIIQILTTFMGKHPILYKYLRVHLMFPSTWSETCRAEFPKAGCNISRPTAQQIVNYPANTARNVARMFSTTKYILIADFEHLFNKGFESAVLKIAQKVLATGTKRVLVYRIFEVDEEAKEPETREELKKMMKEGKAVVFHGLFLKAHGIPGLEDWFAESETKNGLSYENITYNRHNWEPQFVSRSDIPMHDVNFPFLARDNTVLRWELCRADYQFGVLSNHFMYHKGIKRKPTKGLKGNVWKFKQALKGFNTRMDNQYPTTAEKCPKGRW